MSSELSEAFPATAAIDGLNGTLWVAADNDQSPSIILDLGKKVSLENIYLWLENSFALYQYLIEYSVDALQWKVFANRMETEDRGAPRFHTHFAKARYIRITFFRGGSVEQRPAIWEIRIE